MAKAKIKPTVVIPIVEDRPDSAWCTLNESAMRFADDYELASPTRRIAAWVFSIALSAATYSGMALAAGYLALGAMTVTGSLFISIMIQVLGMVLAVYFGMQTFSSTFNYVVSSKCTDHLKLINGGMQTLNRKVGGLFRRKEISYA